MRKTDDSDRIFDQAYLKEVQYGTSANLEARIQIHRLFGTNDYPWQLWVCDQVAFQPGMRALEAGCGPADFWRENQNRLPQGVQAVIGDLSAGMVQQARRNLPGVGALRIDYLQLDAQHIPFPDSAFDLAFANHMLYHVPDMAQALSELARILKPDGVLCAATNGLEHMRQLNELISIHFPEYEGGHRGQSRRFPLEFAVQMLSEHFAQAELRIYQADLHVTQVGPVLAYLRSLWDLPLQAEGDVMEQIAEMVQQEIDQHGFFLINKSQGLVLGYKNQ